MLTGSVPPCRHPRQHSARVSAGCPEARLRTDHTKAVRKGGRMTERFDAIIIGTGQAGPALAVRLAASGRKTAILERKRFGGTCVNAGCIPTKTLIASARAAHVARRGRDFGVVIDGPIAVDMAPRQGAQGRDRRAVESRRDELAAERTQRHADRGPWPLREPAHRSASTTGCSKPPRSSSTPAGAPTVPAMEGRRRRSVSHEHQHDGHRLPARAPDRRRRQLHRPRVRADVPALRQPRHRRRNGAAPGRARGRRGVRRDPDDARRRRHRLPAQRPVPQRRPARRAESPST